MKKDKRTTDEFAEGALDALLATLTDPGEDASFRAKVLARIDAAASATGPRPARRALAGAAIVSAAVTVAFLAWRVAAPSDPAVTRATVGPPTAQPSATVATPAVEAAARMAAESVSAAGDGVSPLPPGAPGAMPRPSRPTQHAGALVLSSDEEALPYGMQRIRLASVSIPPVALSEVREDPTLAALASPEQVRVDPIEIDPIAPRR